MSVCQITTWLTGKKFNAKNTTTTTGIMGEPSTRTVVVFTRSVSEVKSLICAAWRTCLRANKTFFLGGASDHSNGLLKHAGYF
jgi:hypothetical protein